MRDPLDWLAKRAEQEPFFLAAVLAAYAHGEGLDDTALASALGCAAGDLTMIRLCRAPRSESPQFWEDVTAVAVRFGMEPRRLASAVKRGRVVLRLREAPPGGFLAAARDHDSEPPEGP
jgi:hypothetical protein